MAKITLTELRKDLFRLADRALETGEPVVIERNGRTMVLMEARKPFEAAPAQTHAERVRALLASPSPFPPMDLSLEEMAGGGGYDWSPDDTV
ncbi:MAG: type II toxin-antitoxin system Phd/YefM family antitoxin [Caulobacter sp.]|nr:type II toxin-antitoxin system Phd/YefM family antitoxin [Caulobacter sp.]